MSAILKQKLIDIANGFTKYGLWKGGGSSGSKGIVDFDTIITTIAASKRIEYTASENCFLFKQTVVTGSNGNEVLYINGNRIGWLCYTPDSTIGTYALIPLKKDDVVVIENSANETWAHQPATIYGIKYE